MHMLLCYYSSLLHEPWCWSFYYKIKKLIIRMMIFTHSFENRKMKWKKRRSIDGEVDPTEGMMRMMVILNIGAVRTVLCCFSS